MPSPAVKVQTDRSRKHLSEGGGTPVITEGSIQRRHLPVASSTVPRRVMTASWLRIDAEGRFPVARKQMK
jgi:hypothetical protein